MAVVIESPLAMSVGIVDAIAEHGYCVRDHFLSADVTARYCRSLRRLYVDGAFRPAAVGRGSERTVERAVRADEISWLSEVQLGVSFRRLRDVLDCLQQGLNQSLFLNLRQREFHGTIYAPGAFYRRHVDQHRKTAERVITVIVYLNQEWMPADGGVLRMSDAQFSGGSLDVEPLGGRAVFFASDRFPHEVLLSNKERMSICGWLRRQAIP